MNYTETIQNAIIEAVSNVHAAAFAHIEYESTERLPKKYGNVTKVTSKSVQLAYDYENAVNNRLEKQGLPRDFSAKKLPWGEWLIFNKLIQHNGSLYVRCYNYNGAPTRTQYFVDGQPASDEQVQAIKDYKKAHSKTSNTQADAGLDENQVQPFNVNAQNIITLESGLCQYHREDFNHLKEAETPAYAQAHTK